MTDTRSRAVSHPAPSRPLLDVLLVPVPSGRVEAPLNEGHALDIHLGAPVQVSCRIEGRERNGFQTHGLFNVLPAGGRGTG